MTHRGPFRPQTFCDSVTSLGSSILGSLAMLCEAAFAKLQSFPGSRSPEKKIPAQD